jgi:predicted PhzF superfamily epimerase YddE/YHI9
MKVPIYVIDAFAEHRFAGNPAAVCAFEEWPATEVLQNIAFENNLANTAFFVPRDGSFDLRWFTPTAEDDLCGHATLATAFAICHFRNHRDPIIHFKTQSGPLSVERQGELLVLDFPARPPTPRPAPKELAEGLGGVPREVLFFRDYLAVFDSEDVVAAIQPDFEILRRVECWGVIATAAAREVDFVSRFFAPRAGVPEDPVTGSTHCALAPYWGKRLGKTKLHARQISARGGELFCELRGDRVRIAGKAVPYLEGFIHI